MKMKEILANAEIEKMPEADTKNLSGHDAYELPKELKLLSLLNTTKLEPEYYRTQSDIVEYLKNLISEVASEDPYFVAQAIIYSRCFRDGMRSINSLAAALLSNYISGTSWAKRFYSAWDKKSQTGGVVFRLDDMKEIKDAYAAFHISELSNAMKKGFASVLENSSLYALSKYKKTVIDISNLVHPKASLSPKVTIDNKEYSAIDAILKNLPIKAETWESKNTESGQEVSDLFKSGEINEEEAQEILNDKKLENWKELFYSNKLGTLALLRNLRNILMLKPDKKFLQDIGEYIKDVNKLKEAKIMPYQLDYAYESIGAFNDSIYLKEALEKAIENTVSELSTILKGKNLVILDCSGSMCARISTKYGSGTSCSEKASLIAAMIEKASNADLIRFGGYAEYCKNGNTESIFERAKEISTHNFECTNLSTAFELIKNEGKKYDRIFILSDNECNCGFQVLAYQDLIKTVNSPYIYSIDLAGYGSNPLKNKDKVKYYYGYGYALFDDIQNSEFNPEEHIDNVKKIVI